MFLRVTIQPEVYCAELRCELREHRGMELSGNSSRVHQVHQFALC